MIESIENREVLGHRQEMAISALLAQSTLTEAAATCGISERTIRRWLRSKAFFERYNRERETPLKSVVDLLKKESMGAVAVLSAVAHSKQSPAGVRVSAASKIIEFRFRTAETQNLEERIAELEQLARDKS